MLDARSWGRFSGAEPEPGGRLIPSGAIPYSRNLPYHVLLDPVTRGTFLPRQQLREAFAEVGVRGGPRGGGGGGDEEELIVSCGSGVTACVVIFGAELAFEGEGLRTLLFDGSWSEWGLRVVLPLVARLQGEEGALQRALLELGEPQQQQQQQQQQRRQKQRQQPANGAALRRGVARRAGALLGASRMVEAVGRLRIELERPLAAAAAAAASSAAGEEEEEPPLPAGQAECLRLAQQLLPEFDKAAWRAEFDMHWYCCSVRGFTAGSALALVVVILLLLFT